MHQVQIGVNIHDMPSPAALATLALYHYYIVIIIIAPGHLKRVIPTENNLCHDHNKIYGALSNNKGAA